MKTANFSLEMQKLHKGKIYNTKPHLLVTQWQSMGYIEELNKKISISSKADNDLTVGQ